MSKYLKKKGNIWYAYKRIPTKVLKLLPPDSQRHRQHSLETDSKSVAEKRKFGVLDRWQREDEALLSGEQVPDLLKEAKRLYAKGSTPEDQSSSDLAFMHVLYHHFGVTDTDEVDDIARRKLNIPHDEEVTSDDLEEAFGETWTNYLESTKVAQGLSNLLLEHWQDWEKVRKTNVVASTLPQEKSALEELSKFVKTVESLNNSNLQHWVNSQLTDGKSYKTVKRKMSGIKKYWLYLCAGSICSKYPDPFLNIDYTSYAFGTSQKKSTNEAPFIDASLANTVWQGALDRGDQDLADLIAILAYSGLRRNEAVTLTVESTSNGVMTIPRMKTDASNREVPIHIKIDKIIQRRRSAAPTKGKFAGCLFRQSQNQAKKAGSLYTGRFETLRKALGLKGSDIKIHSFRKLFITELEHRKIGVEERNFLSGHKQHGINARVYLEPTKLQRRKEIMALVDYPDFDPSV